MVKFLENLLDILDVEVVITLDTYLADIEEWDSLSIISFAAMADIQYGKKLTATNIKKAQTVNDLFALVSE